MSAMSRNVGWIAMGIRLAPLIRAGASAGCALAVQQHDRLQRREAVERLEALLAAVARRFHAAERQLDAAAGAVVVDENLAAADRARHPQLPPAVARPDA